jgi:NADPH:quinone reductase-like Zn-dependent oxidoreductase
MKAMICTRYGSPEVLHLQEVARPAPRDKELLIRVHAAIVGPPDCAFRAGDPFLVRLLYALSRPRHPILGAILAGEVAAVGRDVTAFKVGDHVCGLSPDRLGAHAEYVCLPEDKPVVRKAAALSWEEAAALWDGAPTALTFLRDIAKIRRGQKVLVNGASGSVGIAAMQLSRYFGAHTTGVCSTIYQGAHCTHKSETSGHRQRDTSISTTVGAPYTPRVARTYRPAPMPVVARLSGGGRRSHRCLPSRR